MKILLVLLSFLPVMLCAQELATVEGRLVIHGGPPQMRLAMVQESESIIRNLDKLVGEPEGKAQSITLQIYPAENGQPSKLVWEFFEYEGDDGRYLLRMSLRLGYGDSFDRAEYERLLLEMLICERALRGLEPGEQVIKLKARPWLVDGISEAILWKNERGDRRLYSSLMETGGWVNVPELVDRQHFENVDVLSRELFRASSGALVMALLSQSEGAKSMNLFLTKAATFQGEPLSLVRSHFPQVNLGSKSLERWWMLQVAAMSEQKLTEPMTIVETEARLQKLLELHIQDDKGNITRHPLSSWMMVSALETPEDRRKAVQPAVDLLAHLSFRCFPTYRPVIAGYMKAFTQIVNGELSEISSALENLETFRVAENTRHSQLVYLMDWHHLNSVSEQSPTFNDYLELKKNLNKDESHKNDPLHQYLDAVEKIYSR